MAKAIHCGPRSVLLHVRIAQALADVASGAIGLAAGNGIGAIIRRVEGAWAVVSRHPDAAERGVRGSPIRRLVPVDHARAHIRPELVVHFRASADEARCETEARVVRL